MPASTQHSISTWSAGWAVAPGPPVWSPHSSGGWLLQGGSPPDVGAGTLSQAARPSPGPALWGSPTSPHHPGRRPGSKPCPSCATSWLARVDMGAGMADLALSSPPQIRSHAWSGPVLPSHAEPPPPPRKRRAVSTGQAREDFTSPISRPRARAQSRGRQARGKGSHATVVTDFLYKHLEGSPLKCPLRGWAWSGLVPSQDQGCTLVGAGGAQVSEGPRLEFPTFHGAQRWGGLGVRRRSPSLGCGRLTSSPGREEGLSPSGRWAEGATPQAGVPAGTEAAPGLAASPWGTGTQWLSRAQP